MAGASLFTLLDDIAALLDDVAVLSKLAAKKTAGVLGDDLALNAQQVTGVSAARELPVVWAVAKGSMLNKAILIPAALALSALEVWLRSRGINIPIIISLMLVGGAFLCFEGVEKLVHHFFHKDSDEDMARREERLLALADPSVDLVAMEKEKVKGAIRTDFILSAEVIVLTLGVVATATLMEQLGTLVIVGALMTVFVYGVVACIVKMDDVGLWLSTKGGIWAPIGRGLVAATPWLMKTLSVVGTLAMFLVGGGIVVHNVPWVHHLVSGIVPASGVLATLGNALASLLTGVVVGAVVLGVVYLIGRLRGAKPAH